jgi:signal transduction histidine kinase/ligand-binding sensor domain-containing protein
MQLRTPHTVWFFLIVLFSNTVIAQSFNRYYNFRHLNVENGLPDNTVYHFLQDSKGFMWLGTRNGITLFDGIRTINYQHNDQDKKSISGDFITRILEDSAHQIWIGTSGGIDLFNRSDNSFIHFSIPDENGHLENTYCVLLGFSNRYDLWIIDTKWKAIRIFNTNSKKFRYVVSTDAVDGMLSVNRKTNTTNVWSYLSIGTYHYIFQKDSLIRQDHFFYDSTNKEGKALQIFHVYSQNDSVVWLSTAKGLMELNAISGIYKIYNQMDGKPVIEIRYISISPKGLMWISTGGFGLYTFDLTSKKFIENYRNFVLDPYSICSNNIVSMYFDKVGNIWCGSFGNGVSYTNVETRFFSKNLSKVELDVWKKENSVYSVSSDRKGNIWCILQDVLGFWFLDSNLNIKEFRQPLLEDGKRYVGSLYQIFFDRGNSAWCTTDRGLYRYNVNTNRMIQVKYPLFSNKLFGSNWTNFIITLHDSSLLFSTMGGLYRINSEKGNTFIRPFSELNEKPFKSFDYIFEDREKNIYVKDIGENLYVLAPSGLPAHYTIKKQIEFPATVVQFAEANAEIYIASNQGLFLLHKNNFEVEKSPLNIGMPFTNVNNVLVLPNKLWVFGDKGLYYYNTTEKSGRLFTIEDGLPSNRFCEYGMVFTSSGKCVTGTNNGFVSFYPEKFKDIIYPPRAQLINMYVNDSVKGFIANPQERSEVVLEHDQNTFSFDFSCISFQHALANKYEYKLDGYDEKWIESGDSRYTRYSKIPPGQYTFKLRTRDAKGDISPYMKTLVVKIKKAFWQTDVFTFLMAVIFAILIWALIKAYLNIKIRNQQRAFEKQQAIEKERTRIATDMHDDLGAGLSSIRFLSEKVRRNSFSDVTKNDIDKIMDHSSELVDKMNEIVWAMNEKNDSLGDLLVYIRSYAKEYCEESGLQCEIMQPDNIPVVFVSGETRRHVFLTIKESLHNIVKHAGASEVKMDFYVNASLSVIIRDNGKGFDSMNGRNEKHGNGLKNMRKRIESMGGSFKIYSISGAVIDINIPLPV